MARPLAVGANRRAGKQPRLTGDDMLIAARLSAHGRSLKQIAKVLSTPERPIAAKTIGTWLRRAKQPAEELHMALASMRAQAVESWETAMVRGARDGRHAPAKDLLIATGTIRPDAQDRLVVVIGNGVADVHSLPVLPPRMLVPPEPD